MDCCFGTLVREALSVDTQPLLQQQQKQNKTKKALAILVKQTRTNLSASTMLGEPSPVQYKTTEAILVQGFQLALILLDGKKKLPCEA